MEDLDVTLSAEVQNRLEDFQMSVSTEDILNSIYTIADAEQYSDLEKSQFADAANRAFPINSAKRCRSAMTYLVKYFNNRPITGVTAGYSEEKFMSVHNSIEAAMEKFGIEHGGCVICNDNKREEASFMDQTDVQDVEQAEVQETIAQEEATESVVTEERVPASNEPEEVATEEVAEASETNTDEAPASKVATLESEVAALQVQLNELQLHTERLRQLDKAGIGVEGDLEKVLLSIGNDMFETFKDYLISQKAEAAEEAEPVEENSETEEPAEEASTEEVPEEEGGGGSEPAAASEESEETASEEVSEEDAGEQSVASLNLETAAGSRKDFFKAIFK